MRITRFKGINRAAVVVAPIAAVALLLTACGSSSTTASSSTSSSSASASTTAAKKKYSIAYVPGAIGVAFYTSLSDGMKAEAQSLGMSYSYQGAAQFSPSAQIPVVAGVCTKHPNILVVSPTDPVALAPAINACISEGVSVITTDTTLTDPSKLISQITTNNLQGGKLAADFLGKKLNGTGQVAILSLSATATTQVARVQGFENEIKAKYPNMSVVTVQYTGQSVASSTSAVNSIMLAHPGVKAFYSVSGTGAEGAAAALASNGDASKVLNVGFDAGPNTVKLLKSGGIAATIAQQPTKEGADAALFGYDKLTGKTSSIQAQVQLPDVLITSAQASQPSYSKYFYKL